MLCQELVLDLFVPVEGFELVSRLKRSPDAFPPDVDVEPEEAAVLLDHRFLYAIQSVPVNIFVRPTHIA